VVPGPGSDLSEALVWGCEPAALDSVDVPGCPSRGRHRADGVVDHVSVDDVGQASLEAAHGRHGRLAGGLLTVAVVASLARVP